MNKLIIIGASGHGKVIADIAAKNGYTDIIFLDDDENIKECAGFPVVGKTKLMHQMDGDKIVAIGNAEIRKRMMSEIECITLIHPEAVISRRVDIGKGSVVMAGAVINSDSKIGKGCIVNTGAGIDHDCSIGDYCHVSVGAHVAGNCKISEMSWIGAGATVSNNVNICSDCMIGAGAVVIKDIKESGTYIGVPAEKMK